MNEMSAHNVEGFSGGDESIKRSRSPPGVSGGEAERRPITESARQWKHDFINSSFKLKQSVHRETVTGVFQNKGVS